MGKSKVEEIENLIEFEVDDKPLTMKTSFPYEKVLNSLKVLDSTKSLKFKPGSINQGRITTLRRLAEAQDLGYVKICRGKDKTRVWINRKED